MTKKYKIILWIATLMTIVSCTENDLKEQDILAKIEHVWDMSDHDLDSALMFCDSLRNSVYGSTEYARMKFDLLEIRLRYKRDLPATIDSISTVTKYMEKHGTARDKMRAYYYMGGIYDDRNDSPKAVEYALKSLSYLKKGQSCDTTIAQMCYSMLSSIYRRQHNSQEAISMALDGLKLSEMEGTTTCWDLMDVAMSYEWVGDKKKCLVYATKAYNKLQTEKNYRKNFRIIGEMMFLFAERKDYNKADILASILETIPGYENSYIYNYSKGVVYETKGEIDSAIAYYEKSVQLQSPQRKREAPLSRLFSIYSAMGEYQKATEYARLFQNGVQQRYDEDQQEWTRNAKGIYEYQKKKEDEEAYIKKNARMKFWGLLGFSTLLFTTAALVALYFWNRKKLLEETIGKEKKLHELRNLVQEKNESIQAKEQTLADMEAKLSKIEKELHQKQALADELIRQASKSDARTHMEDSTERLEKAARNGKNINEEEWKSLISSVNAHHPGFRSKVAERMPHIKEEVLRTCYLMKLGMTNQQIETLMQCAHQTVWNRVKKIREAMGKDILP